MRKLITLILTAVLVFTFFAACGKNKSTDEHYQEYYSFETTKDLYSLWRNNFYGTMHLNTDEKYITHGKASAKVVIDFPSLGRNNLTLLATECMPRLTIEKDNFNKSIQDLSKYAGIRADIYNDNDRDMSLVFYLSNDDEAITARHFKLPKKSWIKAMLPTGQLGKEKLDKTLYIELGFLGDELFEGDTVFYLDNIHLYGSSENTLLKDKTFTENEILSFSSHSDVERVEPKWPSKKIPYTAVSYNVDNKYSKTGSGSMKLSVLPISEGEDLITNTTGEAGKVGFVLKNKFISQVDFTPLHFSQEPTISVDVYNSDDKEHTVYMDLTDINGGKASVEKLIHPYSWTTLELNNFNTIRISDINSLSLTTNLFRVLGSLDLYFSNLRMS